MDMTMRSFYQKVKRWLWLPILCGLLGLGAGFVLNSREQGSYTAQATLVSLNTEKTSLFGGTATIDDLNTSRRIATDLRDIASSQRVASAAQKILSDQGIAISLNTLQSMVVTSRTATDSNVLYLTMRSEDPSIVLPAANAMAQAFVNVLREITGGYYVNILDEATKVTAVSGPGILIYLLLGGVAGGLAGLAAAFILVVLDRRIRSLEDIAYIKNTKLLLIPDHSIK